MKLLMLLHLLHLLGPAKRNWLQQESGKRYFQDTSFSFQQRQSGWKGKSLLANRIKQVTQQSVPGKSRRLFWQCSRPIHGS